MRKKDLEAGPLLGSGSETIKVHMNMITHDVKTPHAGADIV